MTTKVLYILCKEKPHSTLFFCKRPQRMNTIEGKEIKYRGRHCFPQAKGQGETSEGGRPSSILRNTRRPLGYIPPPPSSIPQVPPSSLYRGHDDWKARQVTHFENAKLGSLMGYLTQVPSVYEEKYHRRTLGLPQLKGQSQISRAHFGEPDVITEVSVVAVAPRSISVPLANSPAPLTTLRPQRACIPLIDVRRTM